MFAGDHTLSVDLCPKAGDFWAAEGCEGAEALEEGFAEGGVFEKLVELVGVVNEEAANDDPACVAKALVVVQEVPEERVQALAGEEEAEPAFFDEETDAMELGNGDGWGAGMAEGMN